MKYGFIGVGKMGGAILSGLISSGTVSKEDVYISGRDPGKTKLTAKDLGVSAIMDKTELTGKSDIIFIGVEPKSVPDVMPFVSEGYTNEKIIVSMAAGVTLDSLLSQLPDGARVIRIMPNAPARVGMMMASVSRGPGISDEDVELIKGILSGVGLAEEVPEDQIDAVIGVSGSSPAYTYLYIKALADSAVKYGMDPEKARAFAAQAVMGAAKLVLEDDEDLDVLIDRVCTPGGTTIEAVKYLVENGFADTVSAGAEKAIEKSMSMSGRR